MVCIVEVSCRTKRKKKEGIEVDVFGEGGGMVLYWKRVGIGSKGV